ncbi:MAG: Gfo/Idh/MocA family oxidoreductase [Planctomycetales bacterium]|nr:Gfo/Idh/MocA family oxidoreductase [Planctomycetales bacterium]
MSETTRRDFVRVSSAVGLSAMSYTKVARAVSNGPLPVIGFIGCGGRSKGLRQSFSDVTETAWVCDPDDNRARELRQITGAKHTTGDLRRVLDDKSVDAIVVATPDHWHAPAAILGCAAGKHVYVEKPCSHNFQEGRLLVEAARTNHVVVQHGTQSRSNPLIVGAMQLLREGAIGEVLMAKAWNVQRRENIGHARPSSPPDGVDYDTWVGPAEFMPFQANRFHYTWHWWYNFGTGDIGNDGAHEMDIARWGLGVTGLPSSASAIGGKYYFDDDQQFPDTATCVFQWPSNGGVGQQKQLIFEMRIWSKNYPHNCDTGVEFYGTKGLLFVSKRGKLEMWNDSNQSVSLAKDQFTQESLGLPRNHQVDFLQAISNNRNPAADISTGHDSVALIHLANISLRTGRALQIDPQAESIKQDEAANSLLSREYRHGGHWAVPQVG